MSQDTQSLKIKKGFSCSYKLLTFKYPLYRKTLIQLQKRQFLNEVMFNFGEINLSEDYFFKWAYSGKILLSDDEFRQVKENASIGQILIKNQFQKCSQKEKKQFNVSNMPFAYLLQSSKWIIAHLMNIKIYNFSLLKTINYINFPKLQKLYLADSNLTSIQPLRTIKLSNLRQLHLRDNQITSIKSIQKWNCKKLKFLDLSSNYLNSDKTFQGLTKLNAPKLDQIQLHYQYSLQITKNITQINNFDPEDEDWGIEPTIHLRQEPQKQKYDPRNKKYYVKGYIDWQIRYKEQKHCYLNRQLKYLCRTRPAISMIDYLISQTLNFSQFKFVLKSNLCSDYSSNLQRHKIVTSPYDYFVYYSTNIQKFIQLFKDYWISQGQDIQYDPEYPEEEYCWMRYYHRFQYYQRQQQSYQYCSQQEQIQCKNQRDYDNLVINKKGYFYK